MMKSSAGMDEACPDGVAAMERGIRPQGIGRRCWCFLASRRLSVFLLLGAVGLLLLGMFLPQPPATTAPSDRAAQTAHDRAAQGRSFDWVRAARAIALQAVAAALLLNGVVCSIDRMGRIWRAMRRAAPELLPEEAYDRAPWRKEGVRPDELPLRLYRLREVGTSPQGARFFYCEQGRWAALGTLFTHLGLLFLVAAAIAHSTGSRTARVVLEPATPAVLPLHPECLLTFTGVAGENPGGGVWIEVESGTLHRRIRLAPARSSRACGARLYLSTYGLAWQVKAVSAKGLELPVRYPGDAQWLHFREGQTTQTFFLPTEGITGTVIPSPAALSGRPSEPVRVRLEAADREVLFDDTVESKGQREVAGMRLTWQTGVFLEVEAVADPGFPWLVAGGTSLVLGACLALWWPRRRVWARWTPDGVLVVRTDRGPLAQ